MRLKGMHPLSCITLESPEIEDQSRIGSGIPVVMVSDRSNGNASGFVASFAGVLYKWTNFSKGWRSRWFLLCNGIVSYSEILMSKTLACFSAGEDVRLIGDVSSGRLSRLDSFGGRRKNYKTHGIVHLKRTASLGSFGSFDNNSMSRKSVNSVSLVDMASESEQSGTN